MKVYKWINENIYGSIPVTKTEFDLINTKAFQRLRNIKQLGLAHLVFPTADHSRFSHSLGVMHIIGRMAAHLRNKYQIFNTKEVDKLRIAGLLHDIGHYPLSHVGEKVYQLLTKKEAIITKKRKGNKNEENILHIASTELKQEDVNHEKLGKYVILNREEIKKILERDDFDPNEIAKIINGEHINLAYDQLIHSGLDADRLDYLLRDTTQTGAKYGLVDLDYIIRMLSVGRDENDNVWIGIDKRAIHSIEHFLLARYFSYSQVTWHRTIRGFEIMATALFYEMAKRGMVYDSFEQLKRIVDTDNWINFNDNYFYQKISEFSNRINNELCNILLFNLNNRRRAKLIYEEKDFRNGKAKSHSYAALENLIYKKRDEILKIANEHNIPEDFIFNQELSLKIDKIPSSTLLDITDENKKETIMVIDKGKIFPISSLPSSIIHPLSERSLYCLRLYVVDLFIGKTLEESNNLFDSFISDFKRLYDNELKFLKEKLP